MRAMVIAFLLLAMVLAGCTSKGKDGDGSDSDLTSTSASGTTTGTKSSTATGTGGGNATNAAPTAQLSASTAPGSLQVNFTLDSSDADGDNLTWTLDFGDNSTQANGNAVPANVTHVYAAGNFTATLTVSDGTVNATSTVNVTIAAGAPASQSFEGEWSIGNVDVPAFASLGGGCDAVEPLDGIYMAMFDVDAATLGKPYSATVSATTTGSSIVAWEVKFLDADCKILEGPYIDGSGPITGTVPAGAIHAWMSSDGGAGMTGTYTAG